MGRPGLTNHVKFKRALRALGLKKPALRGHLETMWDTCYESGNNYLGDVEAVEAAAEWEGEQGAFFEAMLRAGGPGRPGFVEEVPGRAGEYQVRNLLKHAPEYVKRRRDREAERQAEKHCAECGGQFHTDDARAKYCSPACRVAAFRERNRAAGEGERNGRVTDSCVTETDHCVTETDCNTTPTPAPTPTPIEQTAIAVSPVAAEPRAGAAAARPSGPPVAEEGTSRSGGVARQATRASAPVGLEFPVEGKGRPADGLWRPSPDLLHEWRIAFPCLDVVAELRAARAWVSANPDKRKTVRGMERFCVAWLSRSQNSGRGRAAAAGPERPRLDFRSIPPPEGVA